MLILEGTLKLAINKFARLVALLFLLLVALPGQITAADYADGCDNCCCSQSKGDDQYAAGVKSTTSLAVMRRQVIQGR